MAFPASMRSGHANGAGQPLRDLSRQIPPQRLIGRGYRDRTELLDRLPDYSRTAIRNFGNRGMSRVQGDGINVLDARTTRRFGCLVTDWPGKDLLRRQAFPVSLS